MAWQTPKTNWGAADVPLPDDFNRIEGNVQELQNTKETPAGAQAKADAAEANAKAYTDAHEQKAAPHSGHETPAGAQAKAEAAAGAVQAELDAHLSEIATQEQLGHVKAGQNITIDSDGTIEVVIDVGDIAGLVGTRLGLGSNASATGDYAVALGYGASAAGIYSVALGVDASAAKASSVALGVDASAAGSFSVALGNTASAENNNEGILGTTGPYTTNKWKVPGDFTVSGTKNFEIPHPKPEKSATHVIRHGAVESPTPGDTLYRWKIQATKDNDIITIDLPDYFIYLNKDVQIWVTGQGHFGNGYGTLNRETEQLEIHCQFAGEYNVLVIGTRNDDHQSVQDWYIKGVEREIGESWTGETYAFSVDEIMEVEEIKEVSV
jgi:hypothetical protein